MPLGACRAAVLGLYMLLPCSLAHLPFATAATLPVAGAASPAGLLPLLEASGAVAGAGDPDWEVVAGSAAFCPGGGGGGAVLAVVADGSIATLVGPTPHVIARGNLSVPGDGGSWSAAAVADLEGDSIDELILVTSKRGAGRADVVVVGFGQGCKTWRVVATVTVPAAVTPSRSWTGVAPGPFTGAGTTGQDLLLLGDASPQFVLIRGGKGAPSVGGAADLMGAANVGWQRVASGEMTGPGGASGTGPGGVVVVRDSGSPKVACLSVSAFPSSTVVATSELPDAPFDAVSEWLHPGVGSILGDGRGVAVLVGTSLSSSSSSVGGDTPVVATLALNGSAVLSVESASRLDAGTWVASTLAPVLGGSVLARPDEVQLVGLRGAAAINANFPVGLLVHGRAEHFLARRGAVANTLSQYAFDVSMNVSLPIDVNTVKRGLADTHANTYSFVACDSVESASGRAPSAESYEAFVRLLNGTKDFAVDGQQLRMWLTLLPPTEAISSACQPPPDSPLTPWNDTALFSPRLGYGDYGAWAELCGRLAVLFPHFVALQIDDMSHDVQPPAGVFTPDLVANMTSALRRRAPWVNLIPTTYFTEGGFVWDLWPDFPKVVDTVLFYFRNQKEGAGPCANPVCPWGPRMKTREGGCLAGNCSEATAQNAPGEIEDIAAGMPPGRPLQVGFYATGHSSLGQPTTRYVRLTMNAILAQALVTGITFYRMHVPPPGGCGRGVDNDNMGCVVAEVFAGAGDRGAGAARALLAERAARRTDL